MSLVKILKRIVDLRYEVKNPWKDNKIELLNNYVSTIAWLKSNEKG